jgi:hypothetical protein
MMPKKTPLVEQNLNDCLTDQRLVLSWEKQPDAPS